MLALVTSLSAGATAPAAVEWTQMPQTTPWSSGIGWNSFFYDTLKHRILFMGIEPNEGNDIYAHTLWSYDVPTNQMTRLGGGLNSLGQPPDQDTCPPSVTPPGQPSADDTPTWPGPRHPYHQMVWDTHRNGLWLMGGVCGGYAYADTYFYDSATEAWTQLQPAHFPTYRVGMSMFYDSDTDALVVYGYDGGASTHDMWIYCPVDGGGSLTPAQSNAGCLVPNDWSEVPLQNGVVDVNGSDVTWVSGDQFDPRWKLGVIFIGASDSGTNYPLASISDANHLKLNFNLGVMSHVAYHVQPPGWTEPGLVYDSTSKKAILYGGGTNQTWSYDVAGKVWRDLRPDTSPPDDNYFPEPTLAYDPTLGRVLFHQRTGAGGPADWSYTLASNHWTQIASGTGFYVSDSAAQASPNSTDQVMVVDPVDNVLVAWSGGVQLWQGQLNAVTADAGTSSSTSDAGGTTGPSTPILQGCTGCEATRGSSGAFVLLTLLGAFFYRMRARRRPL